MGLLQGLESRLAGRLVTDVDVVMSFARDRCLMAPAGVPAAVVRATQVSDVVETLKFATAHGIPVVPRGAGTGLAGAANAIDGCLMLDMSLMNRIISIDPVSRLCVVEPGVLNGDVNNAVHAYGLRYTPDPGSRAISTIGGNINTNAGGMCCPKYGVTADHVRALTAVLANGEVIRTGAATRKNTVGYDLTRLIVGSEGTLAVVVEATLSLRPLAGGTATAIASFADVRSAVDVVTDVTSKCEPLAVELMDRTTIAAVNRLTKMDLDERAGAILLAQFEGPGAGSEAQLFESIAKDHGAREIFATNDEDEGAQFMTARAAAITALDALGTTLLDDICVPVPQLPEMIAEIENAAQRNDVVIGTFGHAADGNLHPTVVFDAADVSERDRAHQAFEEIVYAALALGGTASGEHGMGSLKTEFIPKQLGKPERLLLQRIKTAFDAQGLLNPGRAI